MLLAFSLRYSTTLSQQLLELDFMIFLPQPQLGLRAQKFAADATRMKIVS